MPARNATGKWRRGRDSIPGSRSPHSAVSNSNPTRPSTSVDDRRSLADGSPGRRSSAAVVRRGEAFGLRWRGVDLDARRLRVNRTLGLGLDAEGEPRFEPTKTVKSNRTVRIPGFAVDALRDHRRRQIEERLFAGPRWRDYDLDFTTSIGTPLVSGDVSRSFRKLLTRAGIEPPRFHDLRHGCATLLLEAGEDLAMIRGVLGHSTITLTVDTYAHLTDRAKDQAAARLDALVMGG